MTWSSYAYGEGTEGIAARDQLETRLGAVDAVIHNQDNREHDILDSDDYYQFAGGLSASVAAIRGADAPVYMNDHSLAERPVIRSLGEEISRVVRGRATNPKWIGGVMRHGYKGAFEMAATLDYLFAFAATTRQVPGHLFDAVHEAWIEDEEVRISSPGPIPTRLLTCLTDSRRRLTAGSGNHGATASSKHWRKLLKRARMPEAQNKKDDAMTSNSEDIDRHNAKMAKKKNARDKIMAGKTIEKGLIIVHTGKGKGKSSAAFGMIFRGIAHGLPTAVVQFIKGGMSTGERDLITGHFADRCQFHTMGEGFTWETQDKERDIAAATAAWEKAKELIVQDGMHMVLLDEINIALRYGYIDEAEVIDFLTTQKPEMTHVVLTGRNASEALIEVADLVTEMTLIKHPFRSGVKAQIGVEF